MPDERSSLFFVREKLRVLTFFLVVSCPCMLGFPVRYLTQPILHSLFSFAQCVEVAQLVWVLFFSREILCRCRFSVFVGGGVLRILLHYYLELELSSNNLTHKRTNVAN